MVRRCSVGCTASCDNPVLLPGMDGFLNEDGAEDRERLLMEREGNNDTAISRILHGAPAS